jgi:hypothetical protein
VKITVAKGMRLELLAVCGQKLDQGPPVVPPGKDQTVVSQPCDVPASGVQLDWVPDLLAIEVDSIQAGDLSFEVFSVLEL